VQQYGVLKKLNDLNEHKLIVYGNAENYYHNSNWILTIGMPEGTSNATLALPFFLMNIQG